MLLTGKEIKRQRELGNIVIEPFNEANLSTNSYDVTLNPNLLIYDRSEYWLDMKRDHKIIKCFISDLGKYLEPGILYLGSTNETATSKCYAPMFEGRSSVGRLGITTHVTAGFGDVGWGFVGKEGGSFECTYPTWTLEISVIHPVRVYPNVRIGQVYFFSLEGEIDLYKGKYSDQKFPQASLMYKDFSKTEGVENDN